MNKFIGTYAEFGEYLAKKLAERNHNFDTHIRDTAEGQKEQKLSF